MAQWTAAVRALRTIFTGRKAALTTAVFSPDGTQIATGSVDTTLKLWDALSGAEVAILVGHQSAVTACAFSPDGTLILSGGADGELKMWDAKTGLELGADPGHWTLVTACAFSPDGSCFFSTSEDRRLKLWVGSRVCEYWAAGSISASAWRPDSRVLAAADTGGNVYLLAIENFDPGPTVVTALRSPIDSSCALGCPLCRTWSEIQAVALGTELRCPHCSEPVKLNHFTINTDWHPVMQAWNR
jgi:WD40 repeat protein